MRILFVIALAAATMPSTARAQRGRAEVTDGNRLYSDGNFEAARERYLDALRAAPEVPLIRFNEGNALYQTDDFEEAANSYMAVIESDDAALEAGSWYNIGNALFRQDQLEESLEAFKQALRLNPDDNDARHNLELVLNRMQEDENQEQGDDGNQGQQENQDQPNQDQNENQPQQNQQDRDQEQQDQEQDQRPNEDEQQQQQQQRPPPEMTREEAERLLQAIDEDPNEVRRQQHRARGRVTVAKDW